MFGRRIQVLHGDCGLHCGSELQQHVRLLRHGRIVHVPGRIRGDIRDVQSNDGRGPRLQGVFGRRLQVCPWNRALHGCVELRQHAWLHWRSGVVQL